MVFVPDQLTLTEDKLFSKKMNIRSSESLSGDCWWAIVKIQYLIRLSLLR
jgi:hypothetical protein